MKKNESSQTDSEFEEVFVWLVHYIHHLCSWNKEEEGSKRGQQHFDDVWKRMKIFTLIYSKIVDNCKERNCIIHLQAMFADRVNVWTGSEQILVWKSDMIPMLRFSSLICLPFR